MTEKWERYDMEWVAPDELQGKQFQNPNVLTPIQRARLKRSVEKGGIRPPLLVRLETNEVIDGEHRWEIAQELGMPEVPVIRRPMTDSEARIICRQMLMARGNEAKDYADTLMEEIARLGALEEAQDSLMLSDEEIAQWDNEMDVETIPDPAEEAPPLEEDVGGLEVAVGKSTPKLSPQPLAEEEDEDEEAPSVSPPVSPNPDPRPRAPKNTHRVNCLFLGDESVLVKRVLGRIPAAQIVEMCRYWEENNIEEKLLEEAEAA